MRGNNEEQEQNEYVIPISPATHIYIDYISYISLNVHISV